jgi:penicillin amidase
VLRSAVTDPEERALVERMASWNGEYTLDSVGATLFNEFLFDLTDSAMHDELGDGFFSSLLASRVVDAALPRLVADADSPWWDNRNTPAKETRADTVKLAWHITVSHLKTVYGNNADDWRWGTAHTLTHDHPLGMQKPLDRLFNVGPFPAPGTHEVPNNLSARISQAPWPVTYGPSTRRLIDFADPSHALGINPVGQSGVLFDEHYADQAKTYVESGYVPEHFDEADVAGNTRHTLNLVPSK